MRALIDVSFTDNSSYSNNAWSDVVGMVLPHSWGPVNEIHQMDFATFNRYYPAASGNNSYAYNLAYSCYNAGAGVMEIFNPQGGKSYQHFILFTGRTDQEASINYETYQEKYEALTPTGYSSFDTLLTSLNFENQRELLALQDVYNQAVILDTYINHPACEKEGTMDNVAISDDTTWMYGCKVKFDTTDGNKIIISGVIPYITADESVQRQEGNFIGLKFTPPTQENLDTFSANVNGTIFYNQDLSGEEGAKFLDLWLRAAVGRQWVVDINWGDGEHVVYTITFDNPLLMSAEPGSDYQHTFEEANVDAVKAALPTADNLSAWAGGVAPEKAEEIITYFDDLYSALATIQYVPETSMTNINFARERQNEVNFSETASAIGNINQVLLDVTQKYPGNIPLDGDITVEVDLAYIEGQLTCGLSLIQVLDGVRNVIESHVGGLVPGQIVDGQDYYINSVVANNSDYIACNFDATEAEAVKAMNGAEELTFTFLNIDQTIPEMSETDIQTAYTGYFGNCEMSRATILIPTYESENLNNTVINCAATTMDRVAIVGYPTDQPFNYDSIVEFFNLLVTEKFGIFYAGRDTVTINGITTATSCVGRIAGRYVATTLDAGINQIPSAQSYGSYPGSLMASLTSSEVLSLHEMGGNSVYSTVDGPYIWGVKSMHSRQASYFAKANVIRVISQILYTTFPYLYSVLHTPNTDRKKAMVQANRQAYLDQLISQEVIKADSTAQCNQENNQDWDTNGGEILILDFNIGFIKLIERFKVRITATDSTVTATEV